MSLRSLAEAIRIPWIKRAGIASSTAGIDYAWDRTYSPQWENPTSGLPPISGMGVSSDGKLTIGGETMVQPMWQSAVYTFAANAGIADNCFFVANQAYIVKKIVEIHAVAGPAASTCVAKKVLAGQSVANGTSLHSGTTTFDLNGTAETLQTATLSTNPAVVTLAAGDALAIDFSATLTSLAGVCVVVYLQVANGGAPTLDVTYAVNANATLADAQFFVANDRYTISSARCRVGTVGSSTPKVQLVKDASTNAPGAGTDLLTNNTNNGFALGTALTTNNAVQTATFATTAGLLDMAQGDRLSVDYNGTLTSVAGIVITVSLVPIAERTEVTYFFTGASVNTDQTFFIADRDYTTVISTGIWAVAAGGASTAQIVKDSTTDAPGAGTDLLLAAYDLNTTAQTATPDLLAAAPYTRHLKAGDRLSIDFANAVQSTTGVLVTVGLQAI